MDMYEDMYEEKRRTRRGRVIEEEAGKAKEKEKRRKRVHTTAKNKNKKKTLEEA